MGIFILVFCFILGALFGSFITALVWRTRHKRSMLEQHSICPECQHPLGAIDLVPILSYVAQRGRCRYCQTSISAQYPLIEVITAALFVATAVWLIWQDCVWRLGSAGCSLQSLLLADGYALVSSPWLLISILWGWISVVLLVALCIYDLRWGELPNRWTLGGAVAALIMTIAALVMHQPALWQPGTPVMVSATSAAATIASGLVAALFFLLIVVGSEKILNKPGMGMGDVKLALFMGILLGFPGIVVALYLAFILGAVLSLVLIAAKHKRMGQAIPFGPFMVAGTFLAWWLTPVILDWFYRYLS